jgi:hypothetical protein
MACGCGKNKRQGTEPKKERIIVDNKNNIQLKNKIIKEKNPVLSNEDIMKIRMDLVKQLNKKI